MGLQKMKKQTTELRRKLAEKTTAARRMLKKTASTDSEDEFMDKVVVVPDPVGNREERIRRSDPEGQYFASRGKESTGKSNMSKFAAASAVIATSFSSDTENNRRSHSNSLYRPTLSPGRVQVVHPVLCKRDIYIGDGASSQTKYSGTFQELAVYKNRESRKVMKDVSNDRDPSSTLPPFSVAGSMLCRDMDKGKSSRSLTAHHKKSPQKPMGIPANCIAASMLFRTLDEDDRTLGREDEEEEYEDDSKHEPVPYAVTRHRNSSAESSVSSVTINSTYQSDRMVRASNNLLAILQGNTEFSAFERGGKFKLYEA